MIQHRTDPENIIYLDADIYRLQRRPRHPQVVINDRYRGVLAIDIFTGAREAQVPFGPGYNRSGFIDAWCFRGDGNAVIVMDEDAGMAGWLSLVSGEQSYDLAAPQFDRLHNLRYLWHGDLLLMGKGFGMSRYILRTELGRPVFAKVGVDEARTLSADWLYVQSGVPQRGSNIERIMPDESRLVWHRFQSSPEHVGVLDTTTRLVWSAPVKGDVARLAFLGDVMFILQEFEAHAVDRTGAVLCSYHAPTGYYFTDLDTVPAHGEHPPALVIACNGLTSSYDNCILVFALEESMIQEESTSWHTIGTLRAASVPQAQQPSGESE